MVLCQTQLFPRQYPTELLRVATDKHYTEVLSVQNHYSFHFVSAFIASFQLSLSSSI